jgi:hypothetical protein
VSDLVTLLFRIPVCQKDGKWIEKGKPGDRGTILNNIA